MIVGIFAADLVRRWWKENEWKSGGRRGRKTSDLVIG